MSLEHGLVRRGSAPATIEAEEDADWLLQEAEQEVLVRAATDHPSLGRDDGALELDDSSDNEDVDEAEPTWLSDATADLPGGYTPTPKTVPNFPKTPVQHPRKSAEPVWLSDASSRLSRTDLAPEGNAACSAAYAAPVVKAEVPTSPAPHEEFLAWLLAGISICGAGRPGRGPATSSNAAPATICAA